MYITYPRGIIEESIMEGNGIQNSDVATLSLLGGGAYGYGWGNSGLAFDGSVINANLKSNRDINAQGQDFISQQISDNADRNRDITAQSAIAAGFRSIDDKINDQTRFFAQEVNMLAREQAANARAAAECCCEAKVLAVENQAKTDAGLAALQAKIEAQDLVRDAVANAQQNAKLDAILAGQNSRPGQGN